MRNGNVLMPIPSRVADPDPAFFSYCGSGSGSSSGSRVLMTKNWKNLKLKKIKAEIFFFMFWIKNCNFLILRPLKRTPKLQEKPSALKRKHPAIQNMKFLYFFFFCGSFLPSWIRLSQRDGWLSSRRCVAKPARWVAKLIPACLLRQLSGFESRHLSKTQNGRHKQRSGQHTQGRQKNIQKRWAIAFVFLSQDTIVNFWFGTQFKAMYLPWVLFAFNLIISGMILYLRKVQMAAFPIRGRRSPKFWAP